MHQCDIIQGRVIGPPELQTIQQLLAGEPPLCRTELSRSLCRLWDWRDPLGRLKDMAARTLLLKLHRRGVITLPAPRHSQPNRMLHRQVAPVEHSTEPISADLRPLFPLQISELSREPSLLLLFEWLLHHYHYLSYRGTVGLNLKYLVRDAIGRPLSCLLFGSAAWRCAPRDQFIGWSSQACQAHLQEVTNNTRFLILPWVQVPQMASHILSQVVRRVRQDWLGKYNRPLHLLETFVDTTRFVGSCYRAANWVSLGLTTGRTRQDKHNRIVAPPKAVWVYPLTQDFQARLCA